MSVSMPGIMDEYRRIADHAGWINRSGRGRLRLEGADAGAFLQALVTNDVLPVAPGAGVYAAYLTPNGRMLADLEVYHRGSWWLLDLVADRAPSIAERLDQSIFSEDVRVADVSEDIVELVVLGGDAAARLAAALDLPADRLSALGALAQVDWQDGFVARGIDAALPTFVVFVPAARRDEVIQRIESAGVVPVTEALVESLRIEAGRPRFGVDMNEETIPLEAGLLDRAISTSKGCYVGQEIVIRILHRGGGRVAKRLVTLALETPAAGAPPPATPLLVDGTVVGELTSVAASPRAASLIALGYVRRDLAEAGQVVAVGETGVTATVTGMAG